MLNQITATLTEKNVNIDNMINKSKKAFAYTVIDTNDAIGDDTLAALSAIEGIVRVLYRLIKNFSIRLPYQHGGRIFYYGAKRVTKSFYYEAQLAQRLFFMDEGGRKI